MAKGLGCWEHMLVVWDELKSSKVEKANISVVWLDIANIYCTVPHQVIVFALRRYGDHTDITNLLDALCNSLWSKCLSKFLPSSWHQHFKVAFTGYTIFFCLLPAINVAIKSILAETNISRCFKTLPVKTFMDDLSLKLKNVDELPLY